MTRSFKNEIDILEDISAKLMAADIPFMVTGSMAMNYYAQPRMTRDIDIVISIQKDDVDMLLSLFEKEYYISKEAMMESMAHHSMFNVIHNESIIKVDFIVLENEAYRRTEFERRQLIQVRKFKTYIVTKEDLILSKLIWAKDSHSEMQIRDIRNLMDTGFDPVYLNSWLKKLNLVSFFQEIQSE